jgi:hypothetical protein
MFYKHWSHQQLETTYKAFTFSEFFPYAEYCPLKVSQPNLRHWTWEVVMTLFMGFTIVGYLSIIALLWCFRGFSRELKKGRKVVGVVVRVAPDQTGVVGDGERIQRVLQRELKAIQLQPSSAHSLQSAKVVHLARVLGSHR